ncbi:MAG: hypothetical protein HYS13_09235 [Planctomycetia bacterium]|nr:hypothetical protein [Planctomycetia bacterium]
MNSRGSVLRPRRRAWLSALIFVTLAAGVPEKLLTSGEGDLPPQTPARRAWTLDDVPLRFWRLGVDVDAYERVDKALDQSADLSFESDSLSLVAEKVGAICKVPVTLDRSGLADVGATPATRLNGRYQRASLRSALRHLLGQHELAVVVKEGRLSITSRVTAESTLINTMYDVPDLIYGPGYEDEDSLIDLITTTVAAADWEYAGGAGSIKAFHGRLIISTTEDNQRDVRAVLKALRLALVQQFAATGAARFAPVKPDMTSTRLAIKDRLSQRVDLSFGDVSFAEFVELAAQTLRVPIQVDFKALKDVGIDGETRIVSRIVGARAKVALEEALDAHQLACVVEDEWLLITNKTVAETCLVTRLYPVAELLGDGPEPDFARLIETITTTVAPSSWEDAGGPGSIKEYEKSLCLVVSNTEDVHEQVESLLATLQSSHAAGGAMPLAGLGDFRAMRTYKMPDWDGRPRPSASELVRVVTDLVEPTSWEGKGGMGYVQALTGTIVIHHRPEIQAAAAEVLAKFGVYAEPDFNQRPWPWEGFGEEFGGESRGGGFFEVTPTVDVPTQPR